MASTPSPPPLKRRKPDQSAQDVGGAVPAQTPERSGSFHGGFPALVSRCPRELQNCFTEDLARCVAAPTIQYSSHQVFKPGVVPKIMVSGGWKPDWRWIGLEARKTLGQNRLSHAAAATSRGCETEHDSVGTLLETLTTKSDANRHGSYPIALMSASGAGKTASLLRLARQRPVVLIDAVQSPDFASSSEHSFLRHVGLLGDKKYTPVERSMDAKKYLERMLLCRLLGLLFLTHSGVVTSPEAWVLVQMDMAGGYFVLVQTLAEAIAQLDLSLPQVSILMDSALAVFRQHRLLGIPSDSPQSKTPASSSVPPIPNMPKLVICVDEIQVLDKQLPMEFGRPAGSISSSNTSVGVWGLLQWFTYALRERGSTTIPIFSGRVTVPPHSLRAVC